MPKKPILFVSLTALALLTACGSNSTTAESSANPTSPMATTSASPTAEASTATPTPEPTPEPTSEAPATEEATAEPTPEPTEEPTPEDPFPGVTFAENGVRFFVPENYVQDASPSQPEIFVYQFTHYETADEALGRFMVGTPYANSENRSPLDVEKEVIERLKPAWNIKEVGESQTYTREDGVEVVRTQVQFTEGGKPGYIFTYSNGIELMHSAILIENDNEEFRQKIEDSIAFAW